MPTFAWGQVLDKFDYDFDYGSSMSVTKFHPWKREGCTVLTGQPDTSKVEYHCEELKESAASMEYLLLAWIARKNLGLNQHALVAGVSKALGVKLGS